MTEPERDPRILQAYGDLGHEAPPAALDAAILAAARRRGARWHVPVAAAAALVLAVGVALVVQREELRSNEEVALAPQVIATPEPAARREKLADARKLERTVPAAAPPAPVAASPAPLAEAAGRADQAPASAAARIAPQPAEDRAASVAGAVHKSDAVGKVQSPADWLKRIAELREAGRHQEADERLAGFRRRYPDYEIPEAMRARVLPR